ncbi:hypothetical protein AAMO2058_000806800 [Amorphochlora amoebiformis]
MSVLNVGIFLVLFVVISTGLPIYLHYATHGVVTAIHGCMAFFLSLNTLICLWEIALGLYISHIQADYKKLKEKYGDKPFDSVTDFFVHPLPLSSAVSLRFWTKVWSTYSLYDPSYQNNESFGFFIDVGNGWSTILPSIVWLFAITYHDLVDPKVLGCIGIAKFWQEMYGTVIYALSYFFNKRYTGRTVGEVILFVGLTNGLWFAFPILGIYCSVMMIFTNSYNVFL